MLNISNFITALQFKIGVVMSVLGDETKPIKDAVLKESLGFLEVAGLIGLIVGVLCIFFKKTSLALQVIGGTIFSYLMLKFFAVPIWNIITSIG